MIFHESTSSSPLPRWARRFCAFLHRVHRQLTDVRERLDRGPRQVRAAETHVEHCKAQLATVKAEAKAIRVAADQKQLQLKTSEDKVKDLRRKLNAATSNREYQLLLEQIAADEMANSVLADEILELLEKSDEFQKNVVDAEAAGTAAKRKAEEVRGEVAKAEPSLRSELPGSKRNCGKRRRPCPTTSAISTIAWCGKGRRRPGGDREPMLRRLQPANPAELLQHGDARPAGRLQDVRPSAVSARCKGLGEQWNAAGRPGSGRRICVA